jgi:hypothetical protein
VISWLVAASSLRGANGSRERAPTDERKSARVEMTGSATKQSIAPPKEWIASSQVLLAMTVTEVRTVDYEA